MVLGVTPPFLLDQPSIDRSYLPGVINRYSPFVSLDIESRPARLMRKGWLDSLVARYRYLTHQSRRYKGTVRGVVRWAARGFAPRLADRMALGLVPSRYHHHLRSIDQQEQLREMRRVLPPLRAPFTIAETVRTQWATLRHFMTVHDIDLYVVNMPQSTFLLDDYYAPIYDEYRQLLGSLTDDTPFLDLARSLRDDEFYDVTHLNLVSARQTSRRVAHFMRETESGHRARDPGPGGAARQGDQLAAPEERKREETASDATLN
jgi:hypothetical protein